MNPDALPDDAPIADDGRWLAVALAYAPGDAAPRVVAKGRGLIAGAIIARAHEHEIYVHESAEMVSLLVQVDLDPTQELLLSADADAQLQWSLAGNA